MKKSSSSKSVAFSPNPILSVRLPMWRSKFVVFLLFMAFVALDRARVLDSGTRATRSIKKQGESRYQRRLELPATRGQILGPQWSRARHESAGDVRSGRFRNRCPNDLGADKLTSLGKLLGMTDKELRAEALGWTRAFVYVETPGAGGNRARRSTALDIPGIYSRAASTERFYPEGEITALT